MFPVFKECNSWWEVDTLQQCGMPVIVGQVKWTSTNVDLFSVDTSVCSTIGKKSFNDFREPNNWPQGHFMVAVGKKGLFRINKSVL